MKFGELAKFYGMLILLYFSDMVVLVGLIWNTYKVTHSTYFLGGVLSISILIPFLIRRFFANINLLHLNFNQLYTLRIFAYLIIAIAAALDLSSGYFGSALVIVLYGLLTLSTLSTFEAANFKLVRAGHLSSINASRSLQTVIQTGAFAGAVISGFLLDSFTFNSIIISISFFDIAMSFSGYFIFSNISHLYSKSFADVSEGVAIHTTVSVQPQQKNLIFLIGLIGLHISTFNILTPAIFQSLNNWGSQQFGIASGAACFGAFLASVVATKKSHYPLYALLLMLSDVIFCNVEVRSINVISCFCVGFFLNLVRISFRSEMIDSLIKGQSEESVAACTTTTYSFFQATGPIVMAMLISDSFLGIHAARWLLVAVAALILIGILVFNQFTSIADPDNQMD